MKSVKEKFLEFDVVFEPDRADGGYVVTVPKLPGLVTQGDTLAEARNMAKDAIRCYLEGLIKDMQFAAPTQRRLAVYA